MVKQTSTNFTPEIRERAVRMVFNRQGDHASQWSAIATIAGNIGSTPETFRLWVQQAARDAGRRAGPTSAESERIKALEREVRELWSSLPLAAITGIVTSSASYVAPFSLAGSAPCSW